MKRSFQILILSLVFYNIGLAQNHPPQPICRPLISTLPYNSDSLKVPARFFNDGSYDMETPPELLRYSYSENPDDTIRLYTCESQFIIIVEVYVFDTDGAYDYCSSDFLLYHNYCDSMSVSMTDTLSPSIFTKDKRIPTAPDSNFLSCVSASELVVYGYDNGDISNSSVHYSFSSIEEDTIRCFSCADVGQYPISIYGIDTAGNQLHVPILITILANAGCDQVLDTMRPVAICKESVTFNLDSNKQVIVFPEDLDDGSYDNVTEVDDLLFYFQEFFVDSLILSCKDIGSDTISIFVADESFNTALCFSEVIINDPNNYCNISSLSHAQSTTSISLYPNPGFGFYLQNNLSIPHERFTLKAFSMLGEQVFIRENLELGEFIIPDIPYGMYTIILKSGNGKDYHFKWVKI